MGQWSWQLGHQGTRATCMQHTVCQSRPRPSPDYCTETKTPSIWLRSSFFFPSIWFKVGSIIYFDLSLTHLQHNQILIFTNHLLFSPPRSLQLMQESSGETCWCSFWRFCERLLLWAINSILAHFILNTCFSANPKGTRSTAESLISQAEEMWSMRIITGRWHRSRIEHNRLSCPLSCLLSHTQNTQRRCCYLDSLLLQAVTLCFEGESIYSLKELAFVLEEKSSMSHLSCQRLISTMLPYGFSYIMALCMISSWEMMLRDILLLSRIWLPCHLGWTQPL